MRVLYFIAIYMLFIVANYFSARFLYSGQWLYFSLMNLFILGMTLIGYYFKWVKKPMNIFVSLFVCLVFFATIYAKGKPEVLFREVKSVPLFVSIQMVVLFIALFLLLINKRESVKATCRAHEGT